MTIAEALAQPGPLVAAWDYRSPSHKRLCVYRVGGAGAALVESQEISVDDREDTIERLRQAGHRIGGTYSYNPYVWVLDDQGLTVWDDKQQLVDGTVDELRLATGTVRTREITRVETFFDADDVGHRGVRVELGGARPAVVVDQHDKSPQLDPFYNGDSLDQDIMWAAYLGRDLALWLRVPHVDEHGSVSNQKQLQIAAAARELADQIEAMPLEGEFEHVHHSLGTLGDTGEVMLRFAPNPLELHRRFLELRVRTRSGVSSMGRWIKQGSNAQIAAFLRHLRTPHTVLVNVEDLRRKLVEDEYA